MSANSYHNDNFPVPIKIIVEPRNSSRVSFGKSEIIVRIPKHISIAEKEKTIRNFLLWAKQKIAENNYYKEQQLTLSYYQNRELSIYGQIFKIEIALVATGRNKLSYRGEPLLKIYILETLSEQKQVVEIQRLLLRFTEKYFLSEIQRRTLYWNDFYFKEKIEKIDIKHTVSRWGSCSSSRKISFSTKLLLLPQPVIDYVIVHELAHLKEMNHSAKFWKQVENAMPDYQNPKKWLQQHGNKIHF